MKVDTIYHKSCLDMSELPNESIDTVITSPPYYGLRDYGKEVIQIWGGDKNCEHNFDMEIIIPPPGGIPKAKTNIGQWKRQQVNGKFALKGGPRKSQFCSKCGAWQGALGLEPDFNLYLNHLLMITKEIKRVLKKTGSLFWNMGDTYAGSSCGSSQTTNPDHWGKQKRKGLSPAEALFSRNPPQKNADLPSKCLMGIPWRLVLKMVDEQGWILRNCIIWNKPNAMPSSTKDRLANKYEFLFHLVKNTEPQYYWNEKTGLMADRKPSKEKQKEGIDWDWKDIEVIEDDQDGLIPDEDLKQRTERKKVSYWHGLGYWYDLDAIREPFNPATIERAQYDWRLGKEDKSRGYVTRGIFSRDAKQMNKEHAEKIRSGEASGKNPGDVWEINTQPFPEAHFATFPLKLCERPILATCPLEVCRHCGKTKVRITKPTEEYAKHLGTWTEDTDKDKELRNKIGFQAHTKKIVATADYQTIGWTSCDCPDDGNKYKAGIVLDPFAGAGTALVVAKQLGRSYIGYELVKSYIEMSQKRLEKAVYQKEFNLE